MNDILAMTGRLLAGALLGSLFFGGLWWTVEKGVNSSNPALLFFGSTLLRTGIALAGFYIIARGNWVNILVCLIGFLVARLVVIRLTRSAIQISHAS